MKKRKWININGKWRIVHDRQEAIKGAKFIPCDEGSQIYSWQRTHKKAWQNYEKGPTGAYVPRSIEDVKNQMKKKNKNKNIGGPSLNDDYPF